MTNGPTPDNKTYADSINEGAAAAADVVYQTVKIAEKYEVFAPIEY